MTYSKELYDDDLKSLFTVLKTYTEGANLTPHESVELGYLFIQIFDKRLENFNSYTKSV